MTNTTDFREVAISEGGHSDDTLVIESKALEGPMVNKRIESAPRKKRR